VFAGVQRVHGTFRVPVVHGGNGDGVNVLSLEQFAVVGEHLHVAADDGLGFLGAMLGHVAHGDLHDVVLVGLLFLGADVGLAHVARADVADDEALVGAGDVGGRRLVLAVH